MKKYFATLVFALLVSIGYGQIFTGKKANVSFFSSTPLEDIKAKTAIITTVLNLGTGDFYFKIPVKTFDFPNDLMEEHFNENYLETAKYPDATFKGKVINPTAVNLTKDGTYSVKAQGDLTMHGVTQARTIDATITVKGGIPTINSKFKVKLVDHKIDVPSVVSAKIAEEIDVTVNVELKK